MFCGRKKRVYVLLSAINDYSKANHVLPSCNSDFNYVTVVPDVMVIGLQDVWYVGQKNVQLDCRASANPPALLYHWTRSVHSSTVKFATVLLILLDMSSQWVSVVEENSK